MSTYVDDDTYEAVVTAILNLSRATLADILAKRAEAGDVRYALGEGADIWPESIFSAFTDPKREEQHVA